MRLALQKNYVHVMNVLVFLLSLFHSTNYLLLWKTLAPLPPRVGAPLPLAAAADEKENY